ncbi:hypothetical protein ACJ5H2_00815 [Nocardioides sp. R1-1]|uniref:hypothetical protein n=1 Tax=Nocardioides sp. R1-1 TaxID=3383502 RepID=UPI0038D1FA8A
MTESGSPYLPPPPSPYPHPQAPVGTPPARRSPMAVRHLASAVIALVLTPVGLLVFDYGAGRYRMEQARTFDNSETGGELALILLGVAILVAVGATGRVSGLGPVLAGLVWGLLPFLWFLADLEGFFRFSRDLPTTQFWFGDPPYLFPLVAALGVGAGLAGRWRGRPQ